MTILNLDKFGVAFGDRIILRTIDLQIPEKGIVTLLGPSGTGKSTLLRTICGINNAVSSLRTWGEVSYLGEPLGEGEYPVLVGQKAKLILATVLENIVNDLPEKQNLTLLQQQDLARRLLIQSDLGFLADKLETPVVDLPLHVQRQLAIARSAAASPRLLCIDEPTADLELNDGKKILDYLVKLSQRCAIILVLHNQEQAKALPGKTAFLAGGWIQETDTTENFFVNPQNNITRDFIRTGSCSIPSPNAKPEEIDDTAEYPEPPSIPESATNYVSDSFGPRGFLWLKKGLLAGTPRPGIVADSEYDLKALKKVGIKTLVSLTTNRFSKKELSNHGIEGLWLKIKDMESPGMQEAADMCEQVNQRLLKNEAVAYHCKAGLGRTGTMLAAQLVWEGNTALDALETVRKIEPRWVQSDEQVDFIEKFEDFMKVSKSKVVNS